MSIIAVKGVPVPWSLRKTFRQLRQVINGKFETLNFEHPKGMKKTVYIRLSEKLDPLIVVEALNRSTLVKTNRWTAFMPETIPDLPMAAKRVKLKLKLSQRALNPVEKLSPDQLLTVVQKETMVELQSKYTGLYNLSRKIGHKLLDNIGRTIYQRLISILKTNTEASESAFKLSRCYRRIHPHFGDFQLILSTLHKIQDAMGAPRTQVQEHELMVVSKQPYLIENIPYNRVMQACEKYTDRVVRKMKLHLAGLRSEIDPQNDSLEEIARKKVREQLKKMSPYLHEMISQVVKEQFVPSKAPFYRFRIYGEPFLPSKDALRSSLQSVGAVHVFRSDRICNMMRFSVPPTRYERLMNMDGTTIGGAKLVVRPSDIPLYETPSAVAAEMRAALAS